MIDSHRQIIEFVYLDLFIKRIEIIISNKRINNTKKFIIQYYLISDFPTCFVKVEIVNFFWKMKEQW